MELIGEVTCLPLRHGNEPRRTTQQRSQHEMLRAAHAVAGSRVMTAAVEGDDIREPIADGRRHGQRRYQGVVTLTVHKIPPLFPDGPIYARGVVVVALLGPGPHASHGHAADRVAHRQSSAAVGGQDRDVEAGLDDPRRDLIDVRLHATHHRIRVRRDHGDARSFAQDV